MFSSQRWSATQIRKQRDQPIPTLTTASLNGQNGANQLKVNCVEMEQNSHSTQRTSSAEMTDVDDKALEKLSKVLATSQQHQASCPVYEQLLAKSTVKISNK